MITPERLVHFPRVGPATLCTCLVVWEAFENEFLQSPVRILSSIPRNQRMKLTQH